MHEEDARRNWDSLSALEREIAWLVRQGLKSDEIAAKVELDDDALQERLQAVYRKLGVDDPLALTLFIVYHRLAPRQPQRQEAGGGASKAAAS